MPIKTKTLIFTAGVGAAACLGLVGYVQNSIQKQFINEGFVHESLVVLGNYKEGVEMLGHPMKCGAIDLGDRRNNYCDGNKAKVTVPVKGATRNGKLQCWCSRFAVGERWNVDKCDLEINRKLWTFFIHPNVADKYVPTHLVDDDDAEDHWD